MHIVFASDQWIILASRGRSFQFTATVEDGSGRVLNVPVHWSSSDAKQVLVNSDGLATAIMDTGSATIFASAPAAGVQPEAAAQVIVASPGPDTLVMADSEVISKTPASVTLRRNAQTAHIKPGKILVSGSRGGLLARVTAVTVAAQTITATTVPASLALAFSGLSIDAESTPVSTPLRIARGSSAPVPCRLRSGREVQVSLTGPSVSVRAKVQLIAELQTRYPAVHRFELAVQATVPVTIRSGTVTVSAAGHAKATCDLTVPPIDVPTPVFLGPVEIDGQVTTAAGVTTTLDSGAALSALGPAAADTMHATDGILYTSSGGWQAVKDNWSTGPRVTSAGESLGATLTAQVTASLRVDFGISATFGDCAADLCTPLAAGNLAFTEGSASWNFSMQPPFEDTTDGYQGPKWTADLDLTAGPEITAAGDLAKLLSWIGVTPPARQLNARDYPIPLAGSPVITVSAKEPSSPGGAIGLVASLPRGYSGDTVQFVAYPTTGGPGLVADRATVTGTSARAAWQPATYQSGTFRIAALLFDRNFGASILPYASATVPVIVAAVYRLRP